MRGEALFEISGEDHLKCIFFVFPIEKTGIDAISGHGNSNPASMIRDPASDVAGIFSDRVRFPVTVFNL